MTRRPPTHAQAGAVLPLTLLALTMLLALSALAIDLGMMYWAKQRAQNIADAAALAGGTMLPANTTAAQSNANGAVTSVVAANDATVSPFTLTAGSPSYPTTVTKDDGTQMTVPAGNAITVQGTVNAPLSFAPAIGFRAQNGSRSSVPVKATATVLAQGVCSLPAGSAVVPFGLIDTNPTNDTRIAALFSTPSPQPGIYQPLPSPVLTLSITVWNNNTIYQQGNSDPLRLTTGNGNGLYRNTISGPTSQSYYVGQTTGNPAPQIMDHPDMRSEAQSGIAARLSPSNNNWTHINANGSAYNNWWNAGQPLTDAHILIIPVIHETGGATPGAAVTITNFAVFFVEQPYSDNANNTIVSGRFIGLILPGSGNCTSYASDTRALVQ